MNKKAPVYAVAFGRRRIALLPLVNWKRIRILYLLRFRIAQLQKK